MLAVGPLGGRSRRMQPMGEPASKRLNEMDDLRDMGSFPVPVHVGATANVLLTIVLTYLIRGRRRFSGRGAAWSGRSPYTLSWGEGSDEGDSRWCRGGPGGQLVARRTHRRQHRLLRAGGARHREELRLVPCPPKLLRKTWVMADPPVSCSPPQSGLL